MKGARTIALVMLIGGAVALPLSRVAALSARSETAAKPEDVGLASDRLMRIHETMQRHIDAKDIAGAVTLVARRGRIAHFEAHGFMDPSSKKIMVKDAIFRLASMTKPVT